MVIRCERCSTTYELDESLLASTGSEVQCTKCQNVFLAFPPRSAGRTLVGVPAQPQPAPAQAPAPAPAPASPVTAAPASPASRARASAAPAGAQPEAAGAPSAAAPRPEGGPKPVRTSAPAVYRPQAPTGSPSSAPVSRAPVLKRDTVGTFEARLRWSARWKWLAPALLVGFVVLVAAVWTLLGRRSDPGAERTRSEAVALLALDDGASVEEAATRLSGVVARRPKLRLAAADRALALVVRAALAAEEVEALAARAAEVRDERERARREQGAGWQEAERAASAEAARLEPEVRNREEKSRALASGAREQLGILQAEAGELPEVLRAMALLHAFGGERDRLHRIIRIAREKGLSDPWIDLADGWADARDPDRAARERSLVKLGALAAARPDLLRGRYLLARAQLSLGRKVEALATAEGVLSANPAHEGAKRIRDELKVRAPAQSQAQAAAGPAAAAPPPAQETPPPRRRKPIPQAVPPPSAPTPEAAAADAPVPAPAAAAPEPAPAPAAAPAPAPEPVPAPAPPPPAPAPAPVRAPPSQLGSDGG